MGTMRLSERLSADGAGDRQAAKGKSKDAAAEEEPIGAEERLVTGLARVRAKFAMDPTDPQQALADAWSSPTAVQEEDEAEFVDAVADCLGAGLPLEAALSCWDSGELAYESDADDDEGALPVEAMARHTPAGRRVVVR